MSRWKLSFPSYFRNSSQIPTCRWYGFIPSRRFPDFPLLVILGKFEPVEFSTVLAFHSRTCGIFNSLLSQNKTTNIEMCDRTVVCFTVIRFARVIVNLMCLKEMEVMRRGTMLQVRQLWLSSYFMKGHSKWDNIKDTKVHFAYYFCRL